MYIEKLRSLMEKAPAEASDIAEYAQMLTKYVNTVADQVLATERNRAFLISERIDQSEYIARIERANDERNKAHDKACAACKNINDIAARNGKQKIFDFEPQIENINGRIVFTQDNHYLVAKFCADITNELFEQGALQKSEHLIDEVVEKAKEKPYPILQATEMREKINEYEAADKTEELQTFMNDRKSGSVKLRDGSVIEISKPNSYGEYDVKTTNISDLGSADFYFAKRDNHFIGEEIPKNVIQEIAADHGGSIDIKETEPMRSQLLESILNGDYDRTENGEIPDIYH